MKKKNQSNISELVSLLFSRKFFDLIGVSIFVFILATAAFFFLRKKQYVYVTIRVSDSENLNGSWYENSPEWYIANVSAGLAEKDLLGRTNVEIEDTYYYPVNDTRQEVFVILRVNAVFNDNNQQYSYDGLPLLLGTYHTFNLNGLSLGGIIQNLESDTQEKIRKDFVVTGDFETQYNEQIEFDASISYQGIKKFLSTKLNPGMSIQDSKGNQIVEVLDVKKEVAYKQFVDQGTILSIVDSEREKVSGKVRISTTEVNGKYLYRESQQILLGSVLWLDFDDFTLAMTVSDIQEVDANYSSM